MATTYSVLTYKVKHVTDCSLRLKLWVDITYLEIADCVEIVSGYYVLHTYVLSETRTYRGGYYILMKLFLYLFLLVLQVLALNLQLSVLSVM